MVGQPAAQSLQQPESELAVAMVLRPLVPQAAVFCTNTTSPSDATTLAHLASAVGFYLSRTLSGLAPSPQSSNIPPCRRGQPRGRSDLAGRTLPVPRRQEWISSQPTA